MIMKTVKRKTMRRRIEEMCRSGGGEGGFVKGNKMKQDRYTENMNV
jgi:hypothetical protein